MFAVDHSIGSDHDSANFRFSNLGLVLILASVVVIVFIHAWFASDWLDLRVQSYVIRTSFVPMHVSLPGSRPLAQSSSDTLPSRVMEWSYSLIHSLSLFIFMSHFLWHFDTLFLYEFNCSSILNLITIRPLTLSCFLLPFWSPLLVASSYTPSQSRSCLVLALFTPPEQLSFLVHTVYTPF
jgi:hypothetical protein